jgi:exodeoxyribonuclease-3
VTVRVMTYNIKTGGADGRLPAITAVVRREAPDVLACQELRGFDRRGGRRMRELAGAWGLMPFLARSWFGQPVAVLVRPPAVVEARSAVRWRLHHAAAAVTVRTDRGPLTVVSAHLNPFSAHRRLREARWLAGRFAGPAMVLLAGDLNALDPATGHADRLARLPEIYRRRHVDRRGRPDTRAVAALQAAGFVDLWLGRGLQDDGLTAPTTRGGGREFSGMRLDYLLGTPAVAALVRDVRVVRGAESEHASDHYPVVAELDLTLTGRG